MKNKLCFVMMLGFCSLNSVVLASSNQATQPSTDEAINQSKNLRPMPKSDTLKIFHAARARNQQQQAEEAARAKALRNVSANVD